MSVSSDSDETGVSRRWAVIALSTLILFHVVSHVVWLALDERQVNWDPGYHLNFSLGAWEVITSPTTDLLSRLSKATHPVEPPLIYVVTGIFYALFGFSADAANYTNIFFLCLLVLATYGVGRNLYGRPTGLVAACLVSCYPLVAGYVRVYYLDLGLATVVTISIYALMKTQNFTDRRASMIFGLTFAAGLLTKKAFVIFMFSPMLLVVARSLFNRSLFNRRGSGFEAGGSRLHLLWHWLLQARSRLMNLALALALGTLLSVGWYMEHWQHLSGQAGSVGAKFGQRPLWWYVSWLDDVLSIFAVLLLIVGVAMSLLRRDQRLSIPLTWFVGGLVLHSLIQLGHPRYLLPLLPSIAILSAWWLFKLRPVVFRRFVIAAVVLLSVINYTAFSWYGPVAAGWKDGETLKIFRRPFPRGRWGQSGFWVGPKALQHAYPPRRIGWPFEDIMTAVREDAGQGVANLLPTLVFGAEVSGFNLNFARYFAHLQAIRDSDLRRVLVYVRYWRTKDILDLLDEPYILTKSGRFSDLGPVKGRYVVGFAAIFSTIRETMPKRFQVIREFDLPDGSTASLYRRSEPAFRKVVASSRGGKEPLADLEKRLDLYGRVAKLVPAKHPLVTRAYRELGKMYSEPWTAARIHRAGLEFNPEDQKFCEGLRKACRQLITGERSGARDRMAEGDERMVSADLLQQGPSIASIEAVCGLQSSCGSAAQAVFSFLDHLEGATIVAPGDNAVRRARFAVAGEVRTVLWEHPNSEVTFHNLRIYSNPTLEFGIGIKEKAWDRGGDGVLFEVVVSDRLAVERTVYSRYIDPKNRIEDRKWIDEVVNLRPFAGEVVSITFRTSSGPSRSVVFDWAGWSAPKLRDTGIAANRTP